MKFKIYIFIKQGNYAEAKIQFEKSLAADPDNVSTLNKIGANSVNLRVIKESNFLFLEISDFITFDIFVCRISLPAYVIFKKHCN